MRRVRCSVRNRRSIRTSVFVAFVFLFFGPSPLPFGGFTVLSLTRGPAGNRTAIGSLSATQECRDTNCTARTTCSLRFPVGAHASHWNARLGDAHG